MSVFLTIIELIPKLSDADKNTLAILLSRSDNNEKKTDIDNEIDEITNQLCEKLIIHNKGTGAGGANTNKNGLAFEDKTSNYERLIFNGYTKYKIPNKSGKYHFYLKKIYDTYTITYLTKGGLSAYFEWKFNIEIFRQPDEAYLIEKDNKYTLKILEKKNQSVDGSVDTKLLAGIGFIEEYKACLNENFNVEYGFCISSFLQKLYTSNDKKWVVSREINKKHNIQVLYGDDNNYYDSLDEWISL